MIYRATLERYTNSEGGGDADADSWGGADKSGEPSIINPSLPCFVWIDKKTLITDGVKAGTMEVTKVIFPADADVKCADRISELKNLRGDIIFPGEYEVEEIAPTIAWGEVSFLESTLRKGDA